ncbi:hypothetical protein BC332_10409 [Capsicum chinense]|nr:hypothetical protein BC332_10409 [Capsicum chinense]
MASLNQGFLFIALFVAISVNLSWSPKVMALRDLPIAVTKMKEKLFIPLEVYSSPALKENMGDGFQFLLIEMTTRVNIYPYTDKVYIGGEFVKGKKPKKGLNLVGSIGFPDSLKMIGFFRTLDELPYGIRMRDPGITKESSLVSIMDGPS